MGSQAAGVAAPTPFKQEGVVRTPDATPRGPAPTPARRGRGRADPTFVVLQPHPELGQDVVAQGVTELQDLGDWGKGTGSVRSSAGSREVWDHHPGLGSPRGQLQALGARLRGRWGWNCTWAWSRHSECGEVRATTTMRVAGPQD